MEFTTTHFKRCDLINTSGRIDGVSAPQLEEALTALTKVGKFKIILDMSDVNFMSSAGWWVLIRTQKNCRRYNRGELVLVNVNDRIRTSLDLIGMGGYFKLFADVTSAVGSF